MNTATFKGGLNLPGYKENTERLAIVPASIPELVYLPLVQHIGAPCSPLVKIGDQVKRRKNSRRTGICNCSYSC